MQGNCSSPSPAATLSLTAAEAASLLPLRPFQCMLLMHETFLVVNRGTVWVDNLYLKLRRGRARPGMAFISAGALEGRLREPFLAASAVYVTNVTFHAERRGSVQGISTHITNVSLYVGGTRDSGVCVPSTCGDAQLSCTVRYVWKAWGAMHENGPVATS